MSASPIKTNSVLGRRLRSRRQSLGISQEKVGVAIGLDESSSRTRISRYETGAHEPPLATAKLLAKTLGVPLAYLYCESDIQAEIICLIDQMDKQSQSALLSALQVELKL